MILFILYIYNIDTSLNFLYEGLIRDNNNNNNK